MKRANLIRVAVVLAFAGLASLVLVRSSQAVNYNAAITAGNIAPVAVVQASASGAAAQIVATLPAATGKVTFIEGFDVTSTGSTAATIVTVAVAGPTNTMSYTYLSVAGVTTANSTLSIRFPTPIPASATNTTITVTVPTLGAGNTNSTVAAYGFQQ
jgi:hypothetical protein